MWPWQQDLGEERVRGEGCSPAAEGGRPMRMVHSSTTQPLPLRVYTRPGSHPCKAGLMSARSELMRSRQQLPLFCKLTFFSLSPFWTLKRSVSTWAELSWKRLFNGNIWCVNGRLISPFPFTRCSLHTLNVDLFFFLPQAEGKNGSLLDRTDCAL